MEDGASHDVARSPPPPPDPNVDDATAATVDPTLADRPQLDRPPILTGEEWDITSVSSLGALRMLIEALTSLAAATGDIPPTPPVSRPTTPRKPEDAASRHRRTPSTIQKASGEGDFGCVNIGSPEAHPHEPLTVEVGAHAEDITLQHAAIARRFFSKTAPPFTLEQYLVRLHQICPHSPGVYLTAGVYVHQLCVARLAVPATARTIHRLAFTAIRVAAKTVEDNKWAQQRWIKAGGTSLPQLLNLEIALCFLLDFDLGVNASTLARAGFLLQQAVKHNQSAKGALAQHFKLRLPQRKGLEV